MSAALLDDAAVAEDVAGANALLSEEIPGIDRRLPLFMRVGCSVVTTLPDAVLSASLAIDAVDAEARCCGRARAESTLPRCETLG